MDDLDRIARGAHVGHRVSHQQRLARGWRTGTLKHIDLLERFGRYPHRNAALGRADTPAESAFLARPEFTALFMRSQLPSQARPAGETSALDADDEPRADMEKHARPAARPGAARLLVVPSPKKQTVTSFSPRYCARQAEPQAMQRWAPMMA